MELLGKILIYGTLSVLVGIIVIGSVHFKNLAKSMKFLFILVLVSFLTDVTSVLMDQAGMATMWLVNQYAILESSLLGIIYYLLFLKTPYRIPLAIALSITLVVIIALVVSQSNSDIFNEVVTGIESIVFILLSVGYFRFLLKEMKFESPLVNPLFWFNSGVLIYFSGSFFFFIFSSAASQINHMKIWIIHNIIHLIYTILIAIAFWKARKT